MLQVYRFATEDQCVAAYEHFFQDAQDRSRAAGLTYHPECFALEMAEEAASACSEIYYWGGSCLSAIYHGDSAEGEACETNLGVVGGAAVAPSEGWDNCQKGLYCYVGIEAPTTGDTNSGRCRVGVQGRPTMDT